MLETSVDDNGLALTVTGFEVDGEVGVIGEALTIEGVGAFTLGSNGAYSFTPVANYNGAVLVVTYTVSNGETTDTSTLTLPSSHPSETPTNELSSLPSLYPSEEVTEEPSSVPSSSLSSSPSAALFQDPSACPCFHPSDTPTSEL